MAGLFLENMSKKLLFAEETRRYMKKFKQYQDVIAGVIFLILSAAYYSGSFFETSGIMQAKYGPGFMPKIYAGVMGLLSIALIAVGLWKARKYEAPEGETGQLDKQAVFSVVLSLLLVVGYIYLIKIIGFLTASALYLFCQAWLLSPKKNYLLLILFSAVCSVLIYLLFAKGIGLLLPKGILGF